MRLQPISITNHRIPVFTGDERRNGRSDSQTPALRNADRAATVKDLYEMEDRINANNKKLIKEQNKLIGEALNALINLTYLSPIQNSQRNIESAYYQAVDNANLLTNNGRITI